MERTKNQIWKTANKITRKIEQMDYMATEERIESIFNKEIGGRHDYEIFLIQSIVSVLLSEEPDVPWQEISDKFKVKADDIIDRISRQLDIIDSDSDSDLVKNFFQLLDSELDKEAKNGMSRWEKVIIIDKIFWFFNENSKKLIGSENNRTRLNLKKLPKNLFIGLLN